MKGTATPSMTRASSVSGTARYTPPAVTANRGQGTPARTAHGVEVAHRHPEADRGQGEHHARGARATGVVPRQHVRARHEGERGRDHRMVGRDREAPRQQHHPAPPAANNNNATRTDVVASSAPQAPRTASHARDNERDPGEIGHPAAQADGDVRARRRRPRTGRPDAKARAWKRSLMAFRATSLLVRPPECHNSAVFAPAGPY